MKKLLVVSIFMLLSVVVQAQQRLYNQTVLTFSGGTTFTNNIGWMVGPGIEQVIKSSRNSIFADLFYHKIRKQNEVNREQFIFCPSYGYYLLVGKISVNVKAGVPIGVEKIKIPPYSTTTLPSSKLILGMQLSTQAEFHLNKIINIYFEPFYQYYFQSLTVTNNFGIKAGLKFYL